METIVWLIATIIAIFIVWAQLRTADEASKIRKLLENELKRKATNA